MNTFDMRLQCTNLCITKHSYCMHPEIYTQLYFLDFVMVITSVPFQSHDLLHLFIFFRIASLALRKRAMKGQKDIARWRHQMETYSALLAVCAGNSPMTGELPAQRPVTRSFDVFFDLHLNKRLSKQSWGWWFETPSCPLWHHCNRSSFQSPKPKHNTTQHNTTVIKGAYKLYDTCII